MLVHGHARYALEGGGHAAGDVWWLDEFRDGKLWRVHAYTNEQDARTAAEQTAVEDAKENAPRPVALSSPRTD